MTKSTITRGRLEKIKSWRETYGAGSNVMLPAEEAEELARIALAAMDSEPVAWRVSFTQIGHESNNFTKTYWDEEEKDRWVKSHELCGFRVGVEPLYRHAQQPVVPEVMYWQDAPVDGSTRAAAYATGWNACRAAMLQGAENAEPRCGNSPVIPDGYVMVPVKPTREILDEFDSIIDYGAEDSEDAWRRLLAAAPQEVKGE